MTKQEAYEGIVQFFSRPGAVLARVKCESLNGTPSEQCVYRGDGDPASPIRCAVGCLIPDDEYNPGWEGGSVDHVDELSKRFTSNEPGELNLLNFMRDAQNSHDNSSSVERFLERLKGDAKRHRIKAAA